MIKPNEIRFSVRCMCRPLSVLHRAVIMFGSVVRLQLGNNRTSAENLGGVEKRRYRCQKLESSGFLTTKKANCFIQKQSYLSPGAFDAKKSFSRVAVISGQDQYKSIKWGVTKQTNKEENYFNASFYKACLKIGCSYFT